MGSAGIAPGVSDEVYGPLTPFCLSGGKGFTTICPKEMQAKVIVKREKYGLRVV